MYIRLISKHQSDQVSAQDLPSHVGNNIWAGHCLLLPPHYRQWLVIRTRVWHSPIVLNTKPSIFKHWWCVYIGVQTINHINWKYWCKSKRGWHCCISITIVHTLCSHQIDQIIVNKQEFLWISNLLFPLPSVQMMAKTWMETGNVRDVNQGTKVSFHLVSILHCNPQVLKRVGRQLAPSKIQFFP